MREIVRVRPETAVQQLEWVSGAAEAIEMLERITHDIVLVLADKRLSDGSPFDIFRFVRRNPDCPYPGLGLGLIGEGLTDADLRQSSVLGCLRFLSQPFQPDNVADCLAHWPTDRTDFIVSGSYTGPDRRRGARQQMVERRTISGPAEQTVASTGLGFAIKASTTVFRFRRMPAGDAEPALALRNGLTRETVNSARAHVRLKQEQALAMLGHTCGRLETACERLSVSLDAAELKQLHALALEAGALTETRGLLLVGMIARRLVGFSGDGHPLTGSLLKVLHAHLAALKTALFHEIVDDGGRIGQEILATLQAADQSFAADAPALQDAAMTARR